MSPVKILRGLGKNLRKKMSDFFYIYINANAQTCHHLTRMPSGWWSLRPTGTWRNCRNLWLWQEVSESKLLKNTSLHTSEKRLKVTLWPLWDKLTVARYRHRRVNGQSEYGRIKMTGLMLYQTGTTSRSGKVWEESYLLQNSFFLFLLFQTQCNVNIYI